MDMKVGKVMGWYKIAFPENVFPFDSPETFEKEVWHIFLKNDSPKDFTIGMELDHSYSRIYYFNSITCTYCVELFASYRGSNCDDSVTSGTTITQVVP